MLYGRVKSVFSISFCLCLLAAFVLFGGCSRQGGPSMGAGGMMGGAPKTEVIVDEVQQSDVQLYIYVPGQTAPYKYVDITARVSGYLENLYFQSGSIVKKGDKLALIEQEQYQIALEAAEAMLANAHAREALAKANVDRAKQLVESRALSPEEYQQRQAEYDMSRATVKTAKTSIRQAALDLEYTEIIAPIPGKTTKNLVDVGNFVSPTNVISANSAMGDTTPSAKLLSIAQMDPMYIDFKISDKQFADMKERMGFRDSYDQLMNEQDQALSSEPDAAADQNPNPASNSNESYNEILPSLENGKSKGNNPRIDVSLTTGMDVISQDFPLSGHIVAMIDNKINYETGQVTVRGEVRNPLLKIGDHEDYLLYPGQICRVRIPYENVKDAVLVHEESILTDLDTKYVLVIKKEMVSPKDPFGRPILGPDQKPLPATEEYVVHRQDIQIGRLLDTQMRIVLEGLEKGQSYIVKGVQRARIGAVVQPTSLADFEKRRAIASGRLTETEPANSSQSQATSVSGEPLPQEITEAKSDQEEKQETKAETETK